MRMNHILPLAAAMMFLSSAAFADVDVPPAGNDWSGFYIGAEGGAQFDHTHFALPSDTHDDLQQTSKDRTSITGGGLFGYSFQAGNTVYGIEGDVSSGGGTSSVTACTVPDGCFVTTHDSFTTLNHLKSNWSGRLRARVGFVSGDMLFYAAAGYSYADTKLSLVGLCFNAANPTVPLVFNFARSRNLSGFNLGVGMERELGEHFVARAEYVYDDFGSTTYAGSAEWNDRRISANDGMLRVAVAYRF
ncbi:MAG TPA: outer membrane beta-barrel protein [Rhizomicrobium sp.]